MQQTFSLQQRQPSWFLLLFAILIALLVGLYVHLTARASQPVPLSVELKKTVGIDAPDHLYEEAIVHAAKNLALELDIELENYDISREAYEEIVDMAEKKFSKCLQYRLYPTASRRYTCYTCVSRPKVILKYGQTYKIGQTCGDQKSRYGTDLPEPGLKFFEEFEGNIFEVMVAEYVKLTLFQHSLERKDILKTNHLSGVEMPLPPGNKILR